MTDIEKCKRFIIENLNDRPLFRKYTLNTVCRPEFQNSDVSFLLRYVFQCAKSDERYSYLIAYLVLSNGRDLKDELIEKSESMRLFYQAFRSWIVECLVGNGQAMPPVVDTFGMAFVSDVLDRAEGHLLSLRAFREAVKTSVLRGMVDAVFRRMGSEWILSPSFVGNIGHFAYAATILELQKTNKLTDQPVKILTKRTSNEYMRKFFAPYLVTRRPEGVHYIEMISARKRHYMVDGRWATIGELLSEAVQVWATGRPFASIDPETRERGDLELGRSGFRLMHRSSPCTCARLGTFTIARIRLVSVTRIWPTTVPRSVVWSPLATM